MSDFPPAVDLVAISGFADIYAGAIGHNTADKRLRFALTDRVLLGDIVDISERAGVLKDSSHPNLSPVLDIRGSVGMRPTITVPYYQHGCILKYLSYHPEVNKFEVTRQFALALAFLHGRRVVHGNVTPTNVLIDDDGNVRLSDVGVSACVRQYTAAQSQSVPVPASYAYKSREELAPPTTTPHNEVPISMAGDVYSFACTVHHIYTGQTPVRGRDKYRHVVNVVTNARPLERPVDMPDALWSILLPCLDSLATQRPSMSDIHRQLVSLQM